MPLITLVGETMAHAGNRFYFLGPQSECRECKLKTVCLNLEQGRQYEVVKVRDTHHDCEYHEDGVRAVEIKKVPSMVVLSKKVAIEGSIITFEENDCNMMSCENYRYCHPIGIKTGDKLTVNQNIENVDCPYMGDYVIAKVI